MDRVGRFEPTTSAMPSVVRKELAQLLLGPPLAHLALSDATTIQKRRADILAASELTMKPPVA